MARNQQHAERLARIAAINASDAAAAKALVARRIASDEGARAGLGAAGPFPSLVLNGLVGWYQSNRVQVDANSRVTLWPDQSGSANHLGPSGDPAGATGVPLVVKAAWNNRDVLRFVNAHNDGLISPVLVPRLAVASVFIAVRLASLPVNAGDSWRILAANRLVDPDRFLGQIQNSGGTNFIRGFAGAALLGIDPISTGPNILTYIFNAASSELRINERASLVGNTGANTAAQIEIGGEAPTAAVDGDIGEVMIYNRVLPAAEQVAVRAYLNARWAAF